MLLNILLKQRNEADIMPGLISALILLGGGAIVFLVIKTLKYYELLSLQEKIAWCTSNKKHKRYFELLDHLHNLTFYSRDHSLWDREFPQSKKMMPIETKYWISTDEEREIAKQILEEYKVSLLQKYIDNQLPSLPKFSNGEYFIFTLEEFLEEKTTTADDVAVVRAKLLLVTYVYQHTFSKNSHNTESGFYRNITRAQNIIDKK